MIIKAFVGPVTMVPTKDGPRFRMIFSTSSLSADVFGVLCTFSGKAVTLEVVPGDEQLELFASANVADDGEPPEAPDDAGGPAEGGPSEPEGWVPPGWKE